MTIATKIVINQFYNVQFEFFKSIHPRPEPLPQDPPSLLRRTAQNFGPPGLAQKDTREPKRTIWVVHGRDPWHISLRKTPREKKRANMQREKEKNKARNFGHISGPPPFGPPALRKTPLFLCGPLLPFLVPTRSTLWASHTSTRPAHVH